MHRIRWWLQLLLSLCTLGTSQAFRDWLSRWDFAPYFVHSGLSSPTGITRSFTLAISTFPSARGEALADKLRTSATEKRSFVESSQVSVGLSHWDKGFMFRSKEGRTLRWREAEHLKRTRSPAYEKKMKGPKAENFIKEMDPGLDKRTHEPLKTNSGSERLRNRSSREGEKT